MIDQPLSILDHLHELSQEARDEVVWWVAWHTAWDHCEGLGYCDGYGAAEYRRLTAKALAEGVKPYQCEMRGWIRHQANRPPTMIRENAP